MTASLTSPPSAPDALALPPGETSRPDGGEHDQLATCTEPSCSDGLHYSGRRDPITDEDVEAGPCPAWTGRS
jgi:hypothetical protein